MDKYRIAYDVEKKACYTCIKEDKCETRFFKTEGGECNYRMKPEARQIVNEVKKLPRIW